jgi:hypothetical protein
LSTNVYGDKQFSSIGISLRRKIIGKCPILGLRQCRLGQSHPRSRVLERQAAAPGKHAAAGADFTILPAAWCQHFRPRLKLIRASPPAAVITPAIIAASAMASAASATAPFFARPGFVDHDGAAHQFKAVERLHGCDRLCFGRHFDEGKPARFPGEFVFDQGDRTDFTVGFESLAEIVFRHLT